MLAERGQVGDRTGSLEVQFNAWLAERRDQAMAAFTARSGSAGPALAELDRLGFPLERWPYVLTPQFLSVETLAAFERDTCAVLAAVDFLLRQEFGHDPARLGEALRLTARQQELYRVAADQDWARVIRPDVAFDASGRPWLVELNAGTQIGGLAIADLLGRTYQGWSEAAGFLIGLGFRHVDTVGRLSAHLRAADSLDPESLLVIAYWGHEADNIPPHFYRALVSELRRYGLTVEAATVEELDLRGPGVILDGRPVAALYRFFDESDGGHTLKEDLHTQILDRVASGQVALIGNFVGDIFVNKAFLAIVSTAADSGRLPAAIAARVKAVLPRTYLVADAPEVVYARREAYVLKPADGCGGQAVVFGVEKAQADWECAMRRAEQDQDLWIVQELVDSQSGELGSIDVDGLRFDPYRSVTGVFLFERSCAGAIRRCSSMPTRNVNPSQGAAQGAVLVG